MNIFLIDADNLNSGAWVDEAFRVLEKTEGRLPVRRAYGSAENLKALADTLRVWAVRPFVNMALTKNTTDMALAVDAMELACHVPTPALIVIGSGDADFTPLVVRLRERGIRVVCVSERSKMGREAISAYEQVILVGPEHPLQGATAPEATPASAQKKPSKTPVKTPRTTVATKATASPVPVDKAPVPKKSVPQAPLPKTPAARTPAKKAAAKAAPRPKPMASPQAPDPTMASATTPDKPPAAIAVTSVAKQATKAPVANANQAPALEVAAILAAVPALQNGQQVAISVVAKALRDGKLLGQNAASPKLLSKFPDAFELLPADKPTRVRYRLPGASEPVV